MKQNYRILLLLLVPFFSHSQIKDTITLQHTSIKDSIHKRSIAKSTTRDSTAKFILKDDTLAKIFDKNLQQQWYNYPLYKDSLNHNLIKPKYDSVYYPELPTDTLKLRLQQLNAKTPFNIHYNPILERVIKNYLKHRSKQLKQLLKLSEVYFPMFEHALDNYNLPLEIKYLPIVESALKPKAKSRVGATGLWQFMFATGKQFGLDVSSYVDERSDPIKSTEAACKYLSSLYRIFNDWDLVLAAYNSGPGNVTKAIRRSGGYRNYWNIRPNLPRETAGYLPAFFATMYIFEYAEAHGLKTNLPKANYTPTDTIRVKQLITLKQVSRLIDTPLKELQFLNPSYKLGIIPFIKKERYTLRLPIHKIGVFVANEEKIYALAKAEIQQREQPLPKFTAVTSRLRYTVKSGDYLGKIAQRYGVKVSQIKRWNKLRSTKLKIGQRLTIFPRRP